MSNLKFDILTRKNGTFEVMAQPNYATDSVSFGYGRRVLFGVPFSEREEEPPREKKTVNKKPNLALRRYAGLTDLINRLHLTVVVEETSGKAIAERRSFYQNRTCDASENRWESVSKLYTTARMRSRKLPPQVYFTVADAIEEMCAAGFTDVQICEAISATPSSPKQWVKVHRRLTRYSSEERRRIISEPRFSLTRATDIAKIRDPVLRGEAIQAQLVFCQQMLLEQAD